MENQYNQSKSANLGLVQIFWGNGKGKTTSALGSALRACGSGLSVHLVQFMKNGEAQLEDQYPGEIRMLEKLPNFSYKRFGPGSWYVEGKNSVAHRKSAEEALQYLGQTLNDTRYNLVIADEILYAVQFGLLDEQTVIETIKSKQKDKELILTGSHVALPKIFSLADLITEMKKIKHPFDSGIIARKGIEY